MQQHRSPGIHESQEMIQALNPNTNNTQTPLPVYEIDTTGQAEGTGYKCCMNFFGNINKCLCCICAACSAGPVKVIEQGQVGLMTEFGKYIKKVGPGLYSFNPMTQRFIVVDTRAKLFDLGKQSLLTKDNVTVYVDAYVHYRIVNPEMATFNVEDYQQLVRFMTSGVMKTIVAEHTLSELLTNRKTIEKKITDIIDEKTEKYGILVIDIETQSIDLPKQMERAMATVAEAEKQSEARVIDARGNLESSKIFKLAADELSKNKISLQLQYFECLKHISAEKNSTIIVPDSIIGAFVKN